MDEQKPSPEQATRRDFLKALGLSLGALAGAGVACGRGGKTAVPAATQAAAPSTQLPAVLPPTQVAAATVPAATATSLPAGEVADLVLLGGKVITVDPADAIVQAVAVRGGRIQAIGTDDQIRAMVGPATQAIDLKGRAVTPGMIDAHCHLQIQGLMNTWYVPFLPPEVKTMADLRNKLAKVVARTQKGEWIQGYFLAVTEGGLPNKQDLDPVSPEHPVWIMQQGGHYGSCNSVALRIAGITAATPDPTGGVIERDALGEATGVFYNHRAMDMLRRSAPTYTLDMVRENIQSTQPLFAACGVTSFHDNNVRGVETVAAYQAAGSQGDMILRGAVYYTLEWPSDVDRALKQIDYSEGGEMVRFVGFKFLLDGQAKMAYCHEPHNGVRWDLPTWEPKSFKEAVRALHDTGLQISVHCIGDAAVDLTLDAYEEAMNANPRPDPRHRIEHVIITTPEATRRMRDLGVVACAQPQFLRLTVDGYASTFGTERSRRAIVTREWLENGVHLALGSDAPTTPWYSPAITLLGAVARPTISGKPHEPGQELTMQEALRAHTMGSAYALHEESVKGSIEVGKLADLAVWGEDPLTATPQQLYDIPVDLTLVGGKVIYQRA